MIFLKLGGSLITDKADVEAARPAVLARLAQEVAQARAERPALPLLVSHGSGSFGHVAAARHGTRGGVRTAGQWRGFAEVSDAAARLNSLVVAALRQAGVPALRLQPSASALCADGRLLQLAAAPVAGALAAGLVPVVYGDVAFDRVCGGTIISTEEILAYLAGALPERPSWLLLAGETDGVYDLQRQVIPAITPANAAAIDAALGGSRGTDVTGGMASKVTQMLALTAAYPGLSIRIFSGLTAGTLHRLLLEPTAPVGTRITSS